MNIDELIIKYPEILSLQSYRPFLWTNPHQNYGENLRFTITDIEDAENRFQRFAPFIAEAFPETPGVTRRVSERYPDDFRVFVRQRTLGHLPNFISNV